MANTYLKGVLGFKGERGYSAYEIAVQNGFKGTEKDWLATVGQSSVFDTNRTLYITTQANESVFDLPSAYLGSEYSAISVFISGISLNKNAYTINDETKKVILTTPLEKIGTEVEIVCSTISTNALPIVETINSEATNETTPGTKAVYDYVKVVKDDIADLQSDTTTLFAETTTLGAGINAKFDKANIQVVTGSKANIGVGATETVDVSYPSGFTKANTLIIGKMVSSNNNYYDTSDMTDTSSGFPVIKQVALIDDVIRVWLKNNSTSTVRTGYFKITLLKVS